MLLISLALIFLAVALAAEPAGAGVPSAAGPDSGAAAGPAAGEPPAGEPPAPSGYERDYELVADVEEPTGTAEALAQAAPAGPPAAGEQGEGAGETAEHPDTPEAVLAQFGVSREELAGFSIEQQEQVARILHEHWTNRYAPAAREVYQEFLAVQQQRQEAEDYWRALEEYAQQSGYNGPGGLAAPPRPNGEGELNVDELDPDTRRVYETARGEIHELRGRLDEALRVIDEVRMGQEQLAQAHQKAEKATGDTLAGERMDRFDAAESKRLGFDVRGYPDLHREAWEHVIMHVKFRGLRGTTHAEQDRELAQIFRKGLLAAGFHEVAAKRSKALRSVARPPESRAGARSTPMTDDEIAQEGVDALQMS